jgi:hypothetical protein
MKRFGLVAVVACVWGCALAGPGRADTITYDLYSGGQNGTLVIEFTTPAYVVGTTDLDPFTLTTAPSFLDATGDLFGVIGPPGFQPGYEFFGADGSSFLAIINDPYGNPSNQFPTSPGVFSLDSSYASDSSGQNAVSLDTLVVTGPSTTAAPEPASLTLLGIGALGLAGYGWRLRRRRSPAAAP